MRLWITGAGGFIGRHLVEQAARAGHEVVAVLRPGSKPRALPPEAASLALDLRDAAAVERETRGLGPQAIVHLAWYARPDDYLVADDNVDSMTATLTFARATLAGGCRRMVGVGTCVEYADLPRSRAEDDPLDPQSLYARCKHAAHLVLAELYARHGAGLAWARLFHLHGPGEDPARLIPAVARALSEGRPFSLSPGGQLRDHLDVRDVAAALLHLACSEVTGPINVCSGRPVSLRDVLETLGRELGRTDLLRFGERPYRAGEVMNLTGRAERLLQTGWRPRHSDLAQSLGDTIAAGRGAV